MSCDKFECIRLIYSQILDKGFVTCHDVKNVRISETNPVLFYVEYQLSQQGFHILCMLSIGKLGGANQGHR